MMRYSCVAHKAICLTFLQYFFLLFPRFCLYQCLPNIRCFGLCYTFYISFSTVCVFISFCTRWFFSDWYRLLWVWRLFASLLLMSSSCDVCKLGVCGCVLLLFMPFFGIFVALFMYSFFLLQFSNAALVCRHFLSSAYHIHISFRLHTYTDTCTYAST